ncbi:MAG: short chain dehydrogenase [Actinobacteria bacterium]|uniref:Unannotated protein n=1 Tax=freshwater metagenome TaxID=449393 RepID=A0A6J5Z6T5_9ZZZZ|nr:short chain dehydrogenase [Actinomycetota bacterium]
MKVLVVGATGLIGAGVAKELGKRHEVVPASRSSLISVDVNDPDSIAEMFQRVGHVDAIVSCAGHVAFKELANLNREDYLHGFTDKVLGQVELVNQGMHHLSDGGSITLTSGILGREPIKSGALAALANGALESFVIAAAIDLPRGIRINIVSPTILKENEKAHSFFPGFEQVTLKQVTDAYVKSVDGWHTGQIFKVG